MPAPANPATGSRTSHRQGGRRRQGALGSAVNRRLRSTTHPRGNSPPQHQGYAALHQSTASRSDTERPSPTGGPPSLPTPVAATAPGLSSPSASTMPQKATACNWNSSGRGQSTASRSAPLSHERTDRHRHCSRRAHHEAEGGVSVSWICPVSTMGLRSADARVSHQVHGAFIPVSEWHERLAVGAEKGTAGRGHSRQGTGPVTAGLWIPETPEVEAVAGTAAAPLLNFWSASGQAGTDRRRASPATG